MGGQTTEAKIVFVGEDKTGTAAKAVSRQLDDLDSRLGGFAGKAAGAATAIAGLVATFGLIEKVRGSIDVLDKLDEFAEKTGNSVEKLSELRYAGEAAGTPFDALTGGISKLNKSMAEAAAGGKEAAATFKAMGVEVANQDGSLRTNTEVLGDIADRFLNYEDGAAKAALAHRIFGKSGEEMIPLLNQGKSGIASLGEEAKKLGAIYDGDLAKQAAAFNDNLTKLKIASEAASVALATPLIASLERFSRELLTARKNYGSFWTALYEIGFKTNPFDSWGDNAKKAQVDVERLSSEVARLEAGQRTSGENGGGAAFVGPSGTTRAASRLEAARRELESAQKRKAYFDQLIRDAVTPEAERLEKGMFQKKGEAPNPAHQGGGEKDDPTKKLLENRLKELQRGGDQERELLQQRLEMLDVYQVKELTSVEDYYGRRQGILDESTRGQIKAYDDQIAALRAYIQTTAKQTDRAEAEGKLAELIEKRSKVEREAAVQGLKLEGERLKSLKDYRDSLDELNARLAEAQGRLGEAAAIRFDKQNEALRRQLEANDNKAGLAQLATLKQLQIGHADLAKVQQGAALVQGDLQLTEERITQARERGTIGEIASLKALGAARREALAFLDQQLEALKAISASSLSKEDAQQRDRLTWQRDQLAAQLDPLADRFNTIFSESLGSALTNALTGRASPREALRQFLDGIATQIIDLGMKELAATLFKSSDGGIGALLSRALGGDKGLELGATPANALYVRLADLGSLGVAAGTSGGSGGGIAGLLASTLGPLSNASATTLANLLPGDSLDNLITLAGAWAGVPSFDVGTDYVPQDMLAMIHEGEQIVPRAYNPSAGGAGQGGGMVFAPTFNIDSRADRAAVAAEVTRVTAIAQRQMIEELKRARVLPQ